MGELLTMSGKELERLEILRRLEEGLIIRPKEAAIQLHLSTRQVRSLRASLKSHGQPSSSRFPRQRGLMISSR